MNELSYAGNKGFQIAASIKGDACTRLVAVLNHVDSTTVNEIDEFVFGWDIYNILNERGRIIFHYTDKKGFRGILDRKGDSFIMRFTRKDYLNDLTEGKYPSLLVDYVCHEMLRYKEIDEDFGQIANDSVDNESLRKRYGQQNTYVLSLSSEHDFLPMWNYYCKKDRLSGYAIAMERDMEGKTIDGTSSMTAFPLLYDFEQQYNIVRLIFSKMYALCGKMSPRDIRLKLERILIILMKRFKHQDFSYEKEWRFEWHVAEGDKIKEKGKNKKPYISIKIPKHYINGVILGPSYGREDEACMCEFLKSRGYGDYVQRSRIPIRTGKRKNVDPKKHR